MQKKVKYKTKLVKVEYCDHEKVSYKTLNALEEAHHKHCRTLDKEFADYRKMMHKVCKNQLQMVKENNIYHHKATARYAKLYIVYKRKYEGLFSLREAAIDMGITEEDCKRLEQDAERDFTFKFEHDVKQLENGRIVQQFHLKKKNTKH